MAEEKKKPNYIFGDILGGAMSKVSIQVQYEAALMSTALMMIGLIVTGIYLFIYISFPLWYKIFLGINILAGLVFFWSNLVTQFQAYQSYVAIKEFNNPINPINQKEIKENKND